MLVQSLLPWKSNKYYIFWVCVCSPKYPACNAHAPCYLLWPARFYSIFPHLKTERFSNKKSSWTQNVCFDFLYSSFSEHISFWEELGEMWSKVYTGLRVVYRLFLSDFNETWNFLSRFSINTQKIKIHESPYSGTEFHAYRRTDRLGEANSHFAVLRTRIKTTHATGVSYFVLRLVCSSIVRLLVCYYIVMNYILYAVTEWSGFQDE